MNIRVNGESRQTSGRTVEGLLKELCVKSDRVAVEVNLKIIKKADYGMYEIKEGDAIEIVNFVGGG